MAIVLSGLSIIHGKPVSALISDSGRGLLNADLKIVLNQFGPDNLDGTFEVSVFFKAKYNI